MTISRGTVVEKHWSRGWKELVLRMRPGESHKWLCDFSSSPEMGVKTSWCKRMLWSTLSEAADGFMNASGCGSAVGYHQQPDGHPDQGCFCAVALTETTQNHVGCSPDSLTRNLEAAGILLPGKQTDFTKINSIILSCWNESSRDESSWRVCTFVCEHVLKDTVILFILLSNCGGSFVQLHLHSPWGTFFHRLANVLKPLASWPTHVESLSEATVWQMWTSDFPAIVICRYLSASATLDEISRSEVWVHLHFLSPFSKMYLTGIWFYIWGVLSLFFCSHSDCPSVFPCAGGTWGNLCFFVVFVSL